MLTSTRTPASTSALLSWAIALAAVCLPACGAGGVGSLQLSGAPESAEAGTDVTLVVRVSGAQQGTEVVLSVARGGGKLSSETLTFDEGGSQEVTWTLGVAPIPQEVRVRFKEEEDTEDASTGTGQVAIVDATRKEPLSPEAWGDVHAAMSAAKREGSTEDLAFAPGGAAMMLGVPGGLLRVGADAKAKVFATTGDAIDTALGVAYDAMGRLWICDSKGSAVRRMDAKGDVTTLLTEDKGKPLGAPNHLAVLPSGDVVVSDPCLGRLLWLDGETGAVKARHDFDLAKEGGPNGVALSPDGKSLYVTTENTALLCNHTGKVELTANVAGLFALPIEGASFGARETVAAGVGLFADGLAFDAEGNLYVCIDRVADFKLSESVVEVLPAGGDTLRPLLRATDRIFANVLFGPPAPVGAAAFGTTHLYIALLAVPPFTEASQRGVMRVDLGVTGAPLGHER